MNWLRQVFAQLRGENNRRHTPSSTPQLPPALPKPVPNSLQQPPLAPPPPDDQDTLPVAGLSAYPAAPPPTPPAPPPPSANPASSQGANASNFQVLLSDYRYEPSPAVQSLSNQLANSGDQQSPAQERLSPPIESGKPTAKKSTTRDYLAPLQPSNRKEEPPLQLDDSEKLEDSNAESLMPRRREDNNINLAPPPLPTATDQQTTPEQTSEPVSYHPDPMPTTPDSRLGTITKQGVVKLLFKLKKNNHHGYIAPDDGSKDIIFHQKYIGNDVFCQLERGMAVEVTAHITEGKAYADCVRIL